MKLVERDNENKSIGLKEKGDVCTVKLINRDKEEEIKKEYNKKDTETQKGE